MTPEQILQIAQANLTADQLDRFAQVFLGAAIEIMDAEQMERACRAVVEVVSR